MPQEHPWRVDAKAPVAVALAVLAVAAWKASTSKSDLHDFDDESLTEPPPTLSSSPSRSARTREASPNGEGEGHPHANNGGQDDSGSLVGDGNGVDTHTEERESRRTNCDHHHATNSSRSQGLERISEHGQIVETERANRNGGGSSSDFRGASPAVDRQVCTCTFETGTSAVAEGKSVDAIGEGEVGLFRAKGGGRSPSRAHVNDASQSGRRRMQRGNTHRQSSRSKDISSSGGGAVARRPSVDGEGAQSQHTEATPQDGRADVQAAAPTTVRVGRVASVVSLRRMCHLPGVILRSGLVYERVTSLVLSAQGLGDGDIPSNVARLAGMLRAVDLSRNRLTEVPPGLLQLDETLEELNLGNNEIAVLPPEVATLVGLLSLNLAGNKLARLPAEIGQLAHLKRLGLKGNILVRLPSSLGDLSNLVELYLTGNILEALPNEIVKLRRLRKLQLSFNNLRSLPPGMENLRSLELCRFAVNPGLAVVPEGLAFAERLSWISLAGSAWCARPTAKRRRSHPVIPRGDVSVAEKLGSGASGDVYAGVYQGRQVAVKVFKGDFGPDGSARDELDVACTVDHPNITKAIGVVRESEHQWLVMERAAGKPLAEKPDFSSVLRCRWAHGKRFQPVLVLAVLLQVARAMSYLHERSICHGDLYAHNVLVDEETGAAVLCDFGASFFYPSERHDRNNFVLEGVEVRAFGIMASDMARRTEGCEWIRQDLVPACKQADAGLRPSFHEIVNQLHAELMQSLEPSSPMVTSAKSLHSLLDRPDIAAERGRLRSEERRREVVLRRSSSSSPPDEKNGRNRPKERTAGLCDKSKDGMDSAASASAHNGSTSHRLCGDATLEEGSKLQELD